MSFCLKVHSHPRSNDFTVVWINYNMTPKDVIEILRVQSNMMKNYSYGLMISLPRNKCKWLNDDEMFGQIIIDEDDIVFLQPFYKLLIIELPDKTCTKRKVNIRAPTENVVKELCFQLKIYPYEIWGAYIDARGENILLIPNQSISEQSPDVQKIYLKQYLFPESLKVDVLSPFSLYIFQYRSMIINEQFGNESEDQYYLKGKNWYLNKDVLDGFPHSQTSKRKELLNLFSLKCFGSVYFVVRFHETVGEENCHSFEKFKKLTIAKKALYLEDINCKNNQKTIVPFSSIKYVGIRDEFLKITFGSKEWHFISHRSSEIDVIICKLMKNYNFTIPLTDFNSEIFLPRTCYSYISQIYFLPNKIYTTDDLIRDNMKILASKYSKLVDLYNDDDCNEEYALAQIGINTTLDELSNIFKNQLDIPDNIDQIKLSIERIKSIDSGEFEDQSDYLAELKSSLLKLNEAMNKETENLEYRRIKKRIKRAIDPLEEDNNSDKNTPLKSLNDTNEYKLNKQRNLLELPHDNNKDKSIENEEEESYSLSNDIIINLPVENESMKINQGEQSEKEDKIVSFLQKQVVNDKNDIFQNDLGIIHTEKLDHDEKNTSQSEILGNKDAKTALSLSPNHNILIEPANCSNSFANSESIEVEEEEEDKSDIFETASYNYISTNGNTLILSKANNEQQKSKNSSQYEYEYESSTLFDENDKENECILMFPKQDKNSSSTKKVSNESNASSSHKIGRFFENVETSCPEKAHQENQDKNAKVETSNSTVQSTSNDQNESYESTETKDDSIIKDLTFHKEEADKNEENKRNVPSLKIIDNLNAFEIGFSQDQASKDRQTENDDSSVKIIDGLNSIEINCNEEQISKNVQTENNDSSLKIIDNSGIKGQNFGQNEITKEEQIDGTEAVKVSKSVITNEGNNKNEIGDDEHEINDNKGQNETVLINQSPGTSKIESRQKEITKNPQIQNKKSLSTIDDSDTKELIEISKENQTENKELPEVVDSLNTNINESKQKEITKNGQIQNKKSLDAIDDSNTNETKEISKENQTENKELPKVIDNVNANEIKSKQKETIKNDDSNTKELKEINKDKEEQDDGSIEVIDSLNSNATESEQKEIIKNEQKQNTKSLKAIDDSDIKELIEISKDNQTENKELPEVVDSLNTNMNETKQKEITKNGQIQNIKSLYTNDGTNTEELKEISKNKEAKNDNSIEIIDNTSKFNQNDESFDVINNIKPVNQLHDKPINATKQNANESNSNSKPIIVENDSFSTDSDELSDNFICSPLIKNSQSSKKQSQSQIQRSQNNSVFSPTKRKHETTSKLAFVVEENEDDEDDDEDANDIQIYSRVNRISKSPSRRRNESLISFQSKSSEFPVDVYERAGSKQSLSMSRSHFINQNNKDELEDTSDIESSLKEGMQKSLAYSETNDMKWNNNSSQAVTNNYSINMNQLSPTHQQQQQCLIQQSQMSPLTQSLQPQQFQMQLRAMQSQPQFEMQQVQVNQNCLSPSRSLQPDQFQMQLQMQQNQACMQSPSQSMQYQMIQAQQQAVASPIPVPCFGQISSQFTPFGQQVVAGYQLSPGFYSPSPAASPSTHIEASPKITVKVGGSGGKRRKSKKNKKAHKKWEDESSDSSSYDEESSESLSFSSETDDGCETTEQLIEKIEKSSQKIAELVNSKKDFNGEMKTLGQLLSHLERKFDETKEGDEVSKLIEKIKKILNHKSDKKSCLRLVDDVTKTINSYFAKFKKIFKDPLIRQNNDIIKISSDTNDQDINDLTLSLIELQKSLLSCSGSNYNQNNDCDVLNQTND